MTTAIGFKCQDGIVLGADSEISEGWSKYEESKIHKFTDDCLFAYAGRSLIVRDNLAAFQQAADNLDKEKRIDEFRTIYSNIWREARRREAEGELELQTDFLFVLGDDNLFAAKGGDFGPVTFEVIGSGKDVARSTVDFFGTPLECRQAKLIAVYALSQAKEFTQGSGKRSEVWEMRNGSHLVFKTAPFGVNDEEIEKDFWFLKNTLRQLFIALPDLEVSPDEFSKMARGVVARMRAYRKSKFQARAKEMRDAEQTLRKLKKKF